jgi:DNA-binding transcriptional ArsR family regulator
MATNMQKLQKTSDSLKVMAHPVRLKMIRVLSGRAISVGELAGVCEIPSQMVSSHLRLLSDRGVVKKQRRGRKVFYRLAEPVYGRIIDCLI